MTQGRALATASRLHDAPYQMPQFVSAQFGRAGSPLHAVSLSGAGLSIAVML